MSNETKPKITPTKAEAVGKAVQGIVNLNIVTLAQTKAADLDGGDQEAHANARLYAEAHNVANETGMTPRELLAERNKLIDALRDCLSFTSTSGEGAFAARSARKLLSTLNLPTDGK